MGGSRLLCDEMSHDSAGPVLTVAQFIAGVHPGDGNPGFFHDNQHAMTCPQDLHHYLPVDDQAIDWEIYVTGAGRVTIRLGRGLGFSRSTAISAFWP